MGIAVPSSKVMTNSVLSALKAPDATTPSGVPAGRVNGVAVPSFCVMVIIPLATTKPVRMSVTS